MKWNILFFFFGIACVFVVHFYPTGDWVTGPVLVMFFMAPALVIELVLLAFYSPKRKRLFLVIQFILSLYLLWLAMDYVIRP